jgi:hypothetical protein
MTRPSVGEHGNGFPEDGGRMVRGRVAPVNLGTWWDTSDLIRTAVVVV